MSIVAPAIRDLQDLSTRLTLWLSQKMPDAQNISLSNLSYPMGAGMSHETILFDAAWQSSGETHQRGMVVRIKPSGNLVYQDDMFIEQYQLMKLMHDAGHVRVAEPYWLEETPDLLGAPFFMMEKKKGRVAVSYPPYSQEGWLVDTTAENRRILWEDSVRQLALIQKVGTKDAAFLNLAGDFPEPFDQEVDRWTRYLNWADPEGAQELLRDQYARLLANTPAHRPEGIVWGDARLGNMMIGEDYHVAAVMDWEQPSLGGALHDLGWWLYSDWHQTVGRGLATLDGMGSRADTIMLWEETSGKSALDIDWYESFAVFKMECLRVHMERTRGKPLQAAGNEPGAQLRRWLDQ